MRDKPTVLLSNLVTPLVVLSMVKVEFTRKLAFMAKAEFMVRDMPMAMIKTKVSTLDSMPSNMVNRLTKEVKLDSMLVSMLDKVHYMVLNMELKPAIMLLRMLEAKPSDMHSNSVMMPTAQHLMLVVNFMVILQISLRVLLTLPLVQ